MDKLTLVQENEQLKQELEAEQFILGQVERLNRVKSYDECVEVINELLQSIGEYTKAERTYIFDKIDGVYSNSYEWCKEGIKSEIESMQDIPSSQVKNWEGINC